MNIKSQNKIINLLSFLFNNENVIAASQNDINGYLSISFRLFLYF